MMGPRALLALRAVTLPVKRGHDCDGAVQWNRIGDGKSTAYWRLHCYGLHLLAADKKGHSLVDMRRGERGK